MKFRKMSVSFATQPEISGIFGRMESAHYVSTTLNPKPRTKLTLNNLKTPENNGLLRY